MYSHALFFYACIAVLLWRANSDGFTIPVILGGLSVGIVGGISGIINAHESGHRKKGSLIWRVARLNMFMVLYSHFTTEHNHGHHRNYATELDPLPLQPVEALDSNRDDDSKAIQVSLEDTFRQG